MTEAFAGEVVVTGLGAVSGWGWGCDPLWEGLRAGRSAVASPARFDTAGHRTRLAAEAPIEPEVPEESKDWHRLSRADRFAVAASFEACRQAGLAPEDLAAAGPRAGVFFGSSTAGMPEGEAFYSALLGHTDQRADLRLVVAHQMNGPGDEVARQFGIHGSVQTLSSACAAAGLALGAALDALRSGEAEVALAGGSDALCQMTYAGFNSLRAVDEQQTRPFQESRSGLNLGEGAGVLVLETAAHAARRGARPLARLLGVGASCDAHHMTAPHPEGQGASRAIRASLESAGIEAEEVDFVNTHGTGTPLNDRAESLAFREVFGERSRHLPITSTKGSVGHLLGSSGGLEAVVTVLCLLRGEIHPTPGEGEADPALEVDLVGGAPRPVSSSATAVSTSFAFGGSNAAVVLQGVVSEDAISPRPDEEAPR